MTFVAVGRCMHARARLPDTTLGAFLDEVLVRCKGCSGPVRARRLAGTYWVACKGCGRAAEGMAWHWASGVPELFLQTPCCGEVLWALNERHLEWLEDFVGARLRPRLPRAEGCFNGGLRTQLPKWMQLARNCEEVLRGLGRLRGLLEDAGSAL